MRSYYSIFGCVNLFEDKAGHRRGLRKRKTVTRFFVVSGCIRLYLDEDFFDVNAGEEFVISPYKWYGYEVVHDATVLQMLDDGFEKFHEETREW